MGLGTSHVMMARGVPRETHVRILLLTFIAFTLMVLPAQSLAGIPGTGGLRVLYEADSAYHHIVVVEDAYARYLRFDRSFQSGMLLGDPFESPFLYAAYAHLGLIFRPEAVRVLVVGLGGGSIPKRLWRDNPRMSVDVAELDPKVVEVARRFFALPFSPRLRITAQDGRLFLRKTRELYDLIILDAYYAESIPFHLTTREFLELVKSRLAPEGAVVWNLVGALQGPRSRLFRAMYRTAAAAFPGLYLFPTAFRPYHDVDSIRNIMLVGQAAGGLSRSDILERARRLAPRTRFEDYVKYAADFYEEPIQTEDVPVLTDDYAPVDTLIPLYRWVPLPSSP